MVRFLAVESLLLGCLLSLAGYVFWESLGATLGLDTLWRDQLEAQEPGMWGISPFMVLIAGISCLPIVFYWLLQWLGMTTRSFWVVTLAVLSLQGPAVLAHNRLDWASFWRGPTSSPEWSQITVGALFLLSLVLLVMLHRIAELRRLRGRLRTLGLERGEQRKIITSEILALAGLVGFSLFVTAMLLSAAAALARMNNLLLYPPWTVLTVGTAALLMVAGFLHLWLRTRQEE